MALRKTSAAAWDGAPCTCHEFVSAMGIETYIYVEANGTVLGGEVIDGEWTILDADEAKEEYECLSKK